MHACREQGPGLRGSNLWRASQTLRPAAGEPRRPVHQRGVSCEPRRTTPSSGLGSSDPGVFFTAFGAIALRQRACKEGEECISLCSSVCRGSGRVRPRRGARPGLASSEDSQPRGLVGPQRVPPPVAGCEALPPGMAAELARRCAPARLWRGCGVAVARLWRGQQAGAGLAVAQPMCTALPAWPPSPWPAPAAVLPVTLAVPWPHKFECGDAVNAERALAPPLVMFPGMSLFSFFIC